MARLRFSPVVVLALVLGSALPTLAVDVRLEFPDPVFTGVVMSASLVIQDATSGVRRIELPTVAGLEWETRRGASTQMTIVNGKRNQSETHTIVFRLSGDMPVTIPAVTVYFADDNSISTTPRTVKPEPPNTNLTGEAYAEAVFEPNTIVPGEPSTLIYRLYLRQDRLRAIKEPNFAPPPELLNLGDRNEANSSTVDGEGTKWKIQTWKWPVTAANTGSYTAVGQQKWFRCREDLFRQLMAESEHNVAIKPATLTVLALPDEGRPNDFNGLIGPLDANASIDRARIATGEGTTFTVTLSGLQIGLARRPALPLPTTVQAYPKDDTTDKNVRTFTWDIVPSTTGELIIPAVSFSYFDPSKKNYHRTSTKPLTIDVIPGRQRALIVSGNVDVNKPAPTPEIIALPPPIRGNHLSQPATGRWWIAVLIAVGVGASIGLLQRWRDRPRRGPHRGHALRNAIKSGDLDAIAAAIFSLRPDLNVEQRVIADVIEKQIDQARFGGGQTGELAQMAQPLMDIA
jgi:hypothetical protein